MIEVMYGEMNLAFGHEVENSTEVLETAYALDDNFIESIKVHIKTVYGKEVEINVSEWFIKLEDDEEV